MLKTILSAISTRYTPGEARAIAFLILEDAFGITRTEVYADKVRQFSEEERLLLQNILSRLSMGEPVQHVLGNARFYGYDFKVTSDTLIPRPETEELVAWTIELTQKVTQQEKISLLDGGTGSGCIAITLAREVPNAEVTAWDISENALAIAQENAIHQKVNVKWEKRNLLEELPAFSSMDFIVSNPPYVCEKEKQDIEPHVLNYEPATALFVPDIDPLLFYRALCRMGLHALKPHGWILMEVNRAYAEETAQLFREAGYHHVEVRLDQFGQPRMVGARKG